MQTTFLIRPFKPADLRKVTEINKACLPENYNSFFFLDLHKRFPETFAVAEENGEVIGYVMCRIERGWRGFGLFGTKKGHVVSIAVLPEYRRRGVACALMREAMRGMRQYEVEECYLEVRMSNSPAVAFYRNLGFKVDRTVRAYYADGEDAYIMTKELRFERAL